MKTIITVVTALLMSVSFTASATGFGVIGGGVGWAQGSGSNAGGEVSGAGGGGSALFGFTQQNSSAGSSADSGSYITQTPGNTTTESYSNQAGEQNSWSGSLGLAGSVGGSSFGAGSDAGSVGGQAGFVGGFGGFGF